MRACLWSPLGEASLNRLLRFTYQRGLLRDAYWMEFSPQGMVGDQYQVNSTFGR